MGKIDEKDETDENEDGGSEGCDPVTPEGEEAVGMNQEMRIRSSQATRLVFVFSNADEE